MEKQRLSILGSTGSIGEQTLDIVRENPNRFEVASLTAHKNWQRLAEQAVAFDADTVVIGDEQYYKPLSEALANYPIRSLQAMTPSLRLPLRETATQWLMRWLVMRA